jgi:hypothetical protein
MKILKLTVLTVAALLGARSAKHCTANEGEGASQPSMLEMLCKGAGVPIEDVRWRVQAGLAPEQAVEAALAQQQSDAEQKELAERKAQQEAEAEKQSAKKGSKA